MAKLTQHDRDLRDSQKLKRKLINLQQLATSLTNEHYELLTHQDSNDLAQIIKTFEAMLGRLSGVQLKPKKENHRG